jgi:hypothetical protein
MMRTNMTMSLCHLLAVETWYSQMEGCPTAARPACELAAHQAAVMAAEAEAQERQLAKQLKEQQELDTAAAAAAVVGSAAAGEQDGQGVVPAPAAAITEEAVQTAATVGTMATEEGEEVVQGALGGQADAAGGVAAMEEVTLPEPPAVA